MSSLADQIREAFASGGDTPQRGDSPTLRDSPHKTTLLNYDIDPRSVPDIHLTPGEANQLKAVQEHMRLVAKHDAWDQSAEGSLAGIVNKCSPAVRQAIAASREFVERFDQTGGKTELFGERRELPPRDEVTQKIIDRDYHESAVSSLHERMGTSNSVPDSPPSMRDYVTAAAADAATAEE